MLVTVTNHPRDYAWGSRTLIAQLQGRTPTGVPEAEVWFGDHPGCPARVGDGRTLTQWLAEEGAATGAPAKLPYLVKLLAAGAPLSIQVHPSKYQAEAGFAREESAGTSRDASTRNYRDDNHKPELLVAISDTLTALAGLRELAATRRLLAVLGAAADPVLLRLQTDGAGQADGAEAVADAQVLRTTIAWLLSAEAKPVVAAIHAALPRARSDEFAAELEVACHLADQYPEDPGVAVALLMNLVQLRAGEGLYVAAGVLHAYVRGLGVEVMSASDNVLRGGLTEKHIDVPELVAVLDSRPGPAPVVQTVPEGALLRFDIPAEDFALATVTATDTSVPIPVPITAVAILVVTQGELLLTGARSELTLTAGTAALATPDEGEVHVTGSGQLYLVTPGGTDSVAPKRDG